MSDAPDPLARAEVEPCRCPRCDSPHTDTVRPADLGDTVTVGRICHDCGGAYRVKYIPKRKWFGGDNDE
jgi:hypothetical protein